MSAESGLCDRLLEGAFYVHESSYIDDGVKIGKDTKVWHFCHIMSGTRIGRQCSFGQNCVVGPNVTIGNNVKVQNNVSIYDGVECEDDVFLGPSMVFTNVINPRSHVNRKDEFKRTLLKKGASIGANATIVCGNTIGEYAMVGAGSVVTKAVKAYALVVGVPAKQIGWVGCGGDRLDFDENNQAFDEAGNHYYFQNDQVIKR
ncbi:MAG: acyltransferase [Francisellaceae bacterium]